MASRDQALSLLAASNNHGDLAVKLSSLKQFKEILLSADHDLASDLLRFLPDLQSSPQSLVRMSLVEIIEELGLKAMDKSAVLMPTLLGLLRDTDPDVAKQSIASGTKLFEGVLKEMAMQIHRHGKVERWLEDLWMWMVKFKDSVFAIAFEMGPVHTRLLALKFVETYVLLFSPDNNDFGGPVTEGSKNTFKVSWLVGGHHVIDPAGYIAEAKRIFPALFDLLRAARNIPGCLTVTVVNCLAAIARKRPQYFSTIFPVLHEFDTNFQTAKDVHVPSVQYSFRTAFLGFLRCTYPPIIESREKLVRSLRAMNAGDAAEQAIRQVDKVLRSAERALRDFRVSKDELTTQMPFPGDIMKKRSLPPDEDDFSYNNHEMSSKRTRYSSNTNPILPVQTNNVMNGSLCVNDETPNVPALGWELSPAEQMIAMIGALLAEGERGAESLEILITKMHPDMLADIVILNMKHLPKVSPPLTRVGTAQAIAQTGYLSSSSEISVPPATVNSVQPQVSIGQVAYSSPSTASAVLTDTSIAVSNLPAESRRDPRRDPRRHDPRLSLPAELPSTQNMEESVAVKSEGENSNLSKPILSLSAVSGRTPLVPFITKVKLDEDMTECISNSKNDNQAPGVMVSEDVKDIAQAVELNVSSDFFITPRQTDEEMSVASEAEDMEPDESYIEELEQHSPENPSTALLEDTIQELPTVPLYVELNREQEINVLKLSVKRIIESYKNLHGKECEEMRIALIARLVAQIDANDDLVVLLQRHVLEDYQLQKGHELVLHILYHLHFVAASNNAPNPTEAIYEKFLFAVANSLLDHLPSSDKSFSRLLGEAPVLPNSLLKLLDDICYSDVSDDRAKRLRDADRVTQGLGSVWSLILGRPKYRKSCLDIALKCAVHPQEDIRAKAIRLVANKLYQLSYVSDIIEQFARNMFLSAINQNVSSVEQNASQPGAERDGDKISLSGSEVSEAVTSDAESQSVRDSQGSAVSFPDAQRLISLFFALCTKKPNHLYLVFETYGRAPKTVKQAIHRHIPILLRSLGSSYPELLLLISDPPEGSENLLTLVLQILTDETVPSPELIAAVKHLYETKLKDASILIPMLPSFTKNEVLSIFPRLLDLPPEKFQKALANILQGTAHSGPALTPAEVLVAIHDIIPEKDGLPLKKVMDACSACFEQRTVFTQQVLAKALNQMVVKTPLPLLFMRTVIQAIDAFPTLVDFVMELLSKLVSRQIWKMPKLYVGFLKCIAQTQPHSFPVLLQLPPPQLESSLNKYAHLRGPLSAFASQPGVKASLPRHTHSILGIAADLNPQQPHHSSPLPPEPSSGTREATMT